MGADNMWRVTAHPNSIANSKLYKPSSFPISECIIYGINHTHIEKVE